MRYKAKANAPINHALPLVQHATSDEGTLWNIEQEKDLLCVEFTSNLSIDRLQQGFENAAKLLGLRDPVRLFKIR
ncbi:MULTISPECIES: hypothetical protein [Aliagarivorans]|uniref:hypothetical protein n=1 Tax=Aliagarivorans TaxID=882379 RepID=UPI00041AC3D4|nr:MULTISPECIES: hypothetical protein [Aliagarivorans]